MALHPQARLDRALRSWEGTPFQKGQIVRGAAVDCFRFIISIMEKMNEPDVPLDPKDIPKVHTTSGIHQDREHINAVFRFFLSRYGIKAVGGGNMLEPGDILIFRSGTESSSASHPGHIGMLGNAQGSIWHASPPSVSKTSLAHLGMLEQVYRPDKSRWS